ncbi:c6 and c2h2 transcription factor [Apiospora sp. TS-2023a]
MGTCRRDRCNKTGAKGRCKCWLKASSLVVTEPDRIRPPLSSHLQGDDPPGVQFDSTSNGGRRATTSHSWWWAEIAAVVGSIAAMVALVIVLALSDGRALSLWTFFVQPNTVISILVMVSKTSMLLAVSACLSQLKWKHFLDRPRPLSHLQAFDNASRGPLGSLYLMGNLRLGAVLAFFFALVTTASVAIDPTAQQILEFPSRTTKLENVTSKIGTARQYASKAFDNKNPDADAQNLYIGFFNGNTLPLQSSLLNAVFGQVAPPSYSCPAPATSCSWPDFSTLGVCRSFRNLTDVAKPDCKAKENEPKAATQWRNLTCTYDYTGRNRSEHLVEMDWNLTARNGTDGKLKAFPVDYTWYQSRCTIHTDGFGHHTLSLTSVKVDNANNGISGKDKPPPTEMLQSNWYLCERTHRGAGVESGRLVPGTVVEEALTPIRNKTAIATKEFGGTLFDESFVTYRANSSGREYTTGNYPFQRVYEFLQTRRGAGRAAAHGLLHEPDGPRRHDGQHRRRALGPDAEPLPGDNGNLTMLEGSAFRAETYIHVRWPWFLLALVEVVAAALLVTVTIFITRGEPLLKSSVMALLLHGLDGWGEDGRSGSLETERDLDKRSKRMTAKLCEDDNGWLRFANASS